MSLNIVGNYYKLKSIKLSDSFAVYMQLKAQDEFIEYTSCTGFTLPKLENDEDHWIYGNVSQTFIIPKYDSCKELTLEFYEETGVDNIENFIYNKLCYSLQQSFDNTGLTKNYGSYETQYINGIKIKILDNNFHRFIYEYDFNKLKIVNYNLYNLDYATDAPCKISITFSFEGYSRKTLNEIIDYGYEHDNGKVSVGEIKIETPEDIIENKVQNLRNDINREDLAMFANDDLILLNELEDLDEYENNDNELKHYDEQIQINEITNKKQGSSIYQEMMHTSEGDFTTKYIITDKNGNTIDATQNQQQYEYTQRAIKNNNRTPNIQNSSYNKDDSYEKYIEVKNNIEQKEYDNKTMALANANNGNSREPVKTPNMNHNSYTPNDTENFYANGNNK